MGAGHPAALHPDNDHIRRLALPISYLMVNQAQALDLGTPTTDT